MNPPGGASSAQLAAPGLAAVIAVPGSDVRLGIGECSKATKQPSVPGPRADISAHVSTFRTRCHFVRNVQLPT
ncbi:hypothetical protein KFL_008340020 [Klebsormidium nitens]|uniref:Uncharacterized protein n=1 Tax=Klebsormidium nitens TaxID=105231 RepID=A0A1Y1INK0_KLENI|nr:hypothetical protein KFL_008340020 [Klebsormidium nitens]|eukprot:GAQ91682.1 hypothetical protein KFL_008340020 [Klebsormidium nitens]